VCIRLGGKRSLGGYSSAPIDAVQQRVGIWDGYWNVGTISSVLDETWLYVGNYYGPTLTYLQYDVSSLAGANVIINSVKIESGSAALIGDTFNQNLYAIAFDNWTASTLHGMAVPAQGALLSTGPTQGSWQPVLDIFSSTAAFVDFIDQEANGDGIATLLVKADIPFEEGYPTSPHQEYPGLGNEYGPVLTIDYTVVPEPTTLSLLSLALIGYWRRR